MERQSAVSCRRTDCRTEWLLSSHGDDKWLGSLYHPNRVRSTATLSSYIHVTSRPDGGTNYLQGEKIAGVEARGQSDIWTKEKNQGNVDVWNLGNNINNGLNMWMLIQSSLLLLLSGKYPVGNGLCDFVLWALSTVPQTNHTISYIILCMVRRT